MMQNSSLPGNICGATANRESGEEGGDGGVGEVGGVRTEVIDRNFAGNRWPQEETLALLKIRSEMSSAFKDPGVKAPLWEEVSRKLSELGYNRSAKKCKEKFENIYKYHRRTKEVRTCRSNGKAYRFFEQLEALEDDHSLLPPPSSEEKMNFEVQPISIFCDAIQCSVQNLASDFSDASTSTTSSSSKESNRARKKKRKLVDFVERLMRQVIEKQENFQKQFLEAMEKCEKDRIAREEAWRIEELARIERERELLVQERSIAAAKDAAVLALLQKFSGQAGSLQLPGNPFPVEKVVEGQENTNGGESYMPMGSSRWPKDEVDALIRVRTDLDLQYQENGPKGHLWEEISARMKSLGYDRSAKRCKEKWENMNKYFKRVKESNKKRPEDSKTCPYFQQLDALYKEKSTKNIDGSVNSGYELKPEELLMHMMSTEEQQQPESAADNGERENVDQNHEENGNNEEEGDIYQIVANNPSPMEIIG